MLEKRGWLTRVCLRPSMIAGGFPLTLQPSVTIIAQLKSGELNSREHGLSGSSSTVVFSFSPPISLTYFWLFPSFVGYFSFHSLSLYSSLYINKLHYTILVVDSWSLWLTNIASWHHVDVVIHVRIILWSFRFQTKKKNMVFFINYNITRWTFCFIHYIL